MKRRTLVWHVGPDPLGTAFLPRALEAAAPALLARGLHTVTAAEAADADLDLRRAHASAGRTLQSVDGAWKRVEDQVWGTRGTWLLSTPAVFAASPDRVRLALDGLRGIRLHLVWFGEPAGDTRAWAQPLHPERVHVLDPGSGPDDVWDRFVRLASPTRVPRPRPASRALAT